MIWWSSYVSIHIVKVRSFDRSKGIATKDLTILPRSILPTMAEKSKKEHHFWKTLHSQLLIFLPFDRRWETRIVDHLAASSARSFVRSRVPRNSCNSIFRNWTDFLGRFFFPPLHSLVPCDAIKILDTLRFVHEFPPRHTIFISYEIKRVLYQRIYFFPSYKAASNRCFIRYCIEIGRSSKSVSNHLENRAALSFTTLHSLIYSSKLPRSFHIPGNRFTRLSPTFQHWKYSTMIFTRSDILLSRRLLAFHIKYSYFVVSHFPRFSSTSILVIDRANG